MIDTIKIADFPKKQKLAARAPNRAMQITILTITKPSAPVKDQNKGKWARVAEELSREAPLTGIGDEFLKHTKDFRENFALRNPFDPKE